MVGCHHVGGWLSSCRWLVVIGEVAGYHHVGGLLSSWRWLVIIMYSRWLVVIVEVAGYLFSIFENGPISIDCLYFYELISKKSANFFHFQSECFFLKLQKPSFYIKEQLSKI